MTSRRRQDGDTALLWAAQRGRSDAVRMLLESGADPNPRDKVGRRGGETTLRRRGTERGGTEREDGVRQRAQVSVSDD